jgi:hypothetical protein
LTIEGCVGDNSPFATGGLVNDINISGNVGGFTLDPLCHSSQNYDNINLEAIADNLQKVINTAGCGLFKEHKYGD